MAATTVEEGVTAHLGDLRRFARSLVGPQATADVDDLVQDCVVRALERAEQFEPGTNLKAWLFTLMRTLFISARRHDAVCRRHADGVARGPAQVSQPVQLQYVMLRETARALRRLEVDDLCLIRDLALAGQPYQLVAARCGMPVGTMKSRLSRSRDKLRRNLEMDRSPVTAALAA